MLWIPQIHLPRVGLSIRFTNCAHYVVCRLSPNNGAAPIAERSLNAFVAALAPNVYGSSTIGVKKSTVATMARSSVSRYTAASSRVRVPTSTRESSTTGK